MKKLNLNFYGLMVKVSSYQDLEAINLLAKDFSFFKVEVEKETTWDFSLEILEEKPPWEIVPKVKATMQTINSICYDVGVNRFCDYYGELLVVLDKKKNNAKLYSLNKKKIHEVAYLLTLSRVGKKMDLMGLHKLHAFSVSFNDVAIVCMMPMKGGKSTLLMEFLKDPRFKMISDDIPLVNSRGEILPFPIKIGLSDHVTELKVFEPEKNLYTMDRGQYGVKKLLCLDGIPGRIEEPFKRFKKIILIESFRMNSPNSLLKKSNLFMTFLGLAKHGVIGFGLPMVIEYFWENGPVDFVVKIQIFFRRLWAFSCLSLRSDKMKLYLGRDPKEAAMIIAEYAMRSSK